MRTKADLRHLGAAHGIYYLVTGIWPVVSLTTFEWVTGPKKDGWLVKMVGLLAAVIGLSVLRTTGKGARPDPALVVGAPVAFAAIDTFYVARRRIRPVYLLDAAVEALLAWRWSTGRRKLEG
jgi:hypothetical protein